jgi:hypothetical protein
LSEAGSLQLKILAERFNVCLFRNIGFDGMGIEVAIGAFANTPGHMHV